jgi:hypothetical protein
MEKMHIGRERIRERMRSKRNKRPKKLERGLLASCMDFDLAACMY